jgi:hypothetical protein
MTKFYKQVIAFLRWFFAWSEWEAYRDAELEKRRLAALKKQEKEAKNETAN